jgi:hypothetical protein
MDELSFKQSQNFKDKQRKVQFNLEFYTISEMCCASECWREMLRHFHA